MRLVLTVHQFLPDYSAGTEILTFETAKELQKRGHDVVVWTGNPTKANSFIDQYIYQGIPVRRYNLNVTDTAALSNKVEVGYKNRQFAQTFGDFLKEYQPDIIHFFHLNGLSVDIIHSGWELGLPMVYTATDFWMICPTAQLRMPDNADCLGPDRHSVNCLRHIVANSQPQAVNNILNCLPNWVLTFICRGSRNNWWSERKYSPMIASLVSRKDYLRNALNQVDRVLVPTRFMNDILVSNGIRQNRILIQSFGINLGQKKALAKTLNMKLRIGFIGTLSEHKGVHVLLDAINYLDKCTPIEVKIYGEGKEFPEYFARLKGMAEKDPRVKFCGTFPNSEIGRIFSGLDVLVVPSLWYENTPLVIYSAQAERIPVIASNLPGIADVIEHERNGLFFDKGDARGLAAQIKRLINDRALLTQFSKQAKQPKTLCTYVDELEGIYKNILSERGKSK